MPLFKQQKSCCSSLCRASHRKEPLKTPTSQQNPTVCRTWLILTLHSIKQPLVTSGLPEHIKMFSFWQQFLWRCNNIRFCFFFFLNKFYFQILLLNHGAGPVQVWRRQSREPVAVTAPLPAPSCPRFGQCGDGSQLPRMRGCVFV